MKTQIQMYDEIKKRFSDFNKAVLYSDKYDQEKAYFVGIVIFTSKEINDNILKTIKELKKIAPKNLYISKDFLHITFQEIALLPEKFDSSIYLNYIKKINSVIKKLKPFKIQIKGINHFPTAIFAQVFSKDNQIYKSQEIMKKAFPKSHSKFSYVPHVTMAQFLEKPKKLFEAIKQFDNTNFGEMLVDKIALVKCELPSKGEKFEIIKTFNLD